MKLDFPNNKHKLQYENLIKEREEVESIPASPKALFKGNNFEDFLKIIRKDVYNNEKGVNGHLFFLCDKNKILGAMHIRHNINHLNLIERGGHIGYGIAPKFRKKGYGTKMLKLGLIEARILGIKKVLITCDIDNIGSNKIIKKNGGILERRTKCGKLNRYWIEL